MNEVQERVQSKPVAASQVAKAAVSETNQFLTFLLANEMYAISINNVKEIIGYAQPTEIPMMPSFIRGVINLRGAVVPVIDLAARFGSGETKIAPRSCIVIVEVRDGTGEGKRDLGIIVDAVSEVLDIPRSEIQPPPSFGAKINADFMAGMGKVGGKFVMILDIARVLSIDDMAMLADVGSAAEEAVAH